MKYFIAVILITSFFCCKSGKIRELQDREIEVNNPEIFDTLVIDNNIAVLWWPDSNDQVIMKENYDEISYNKFVDDMTWYTQKAVKLFDSMRVDNRITDMDIIIFKKPDSTELILRRKEVKGNMVLFNLEKEPLILSLDQYDKKQVLDFYR